MKKKSKNLAVIATIVICSLFIVFTNYIFTQSMALKMEDVIMEHEYKKIGWESNYKLLQEIQKKEVWELLEKLKQENPEYIYNLKQESLKDSNKLSWEMYREIQSLYDAESLSGSTNLILEFSDLECAHCKDFRQSGTLTKLQESYPNIKYNFQNFPLPKHKNALREAVAGKCILGIGWPEKYSDYIDIVFAETNSGGEGFDLNKLDEIRENLLIDKEKFEICFQDPDSKKLALEEFERGRKLWVNSTPSFVIIDRNTGGYEIVSKDLSLNNLAKIIEN